MFININGVELYYEKRGPEEARPLILVHGNGEDHSIFEQSLLLLEKRFCCYAVDSRCHGQSGEGPLHYSDMAADMLAFLEVLELRDVIFSASATAVSWGSLRPLRRTASLHLSPAEQTSTRTA